MGNGVGIGSERAVSVAVDAVIERRDFGSRRHADEHGGYRVNTCLRRRVGDEVTIQNNCSAYSGINTKTIVAAGTIGICAVAADRILFENCQGIGATHIHTPVQVIGDETFGHYGPQAVACAGREIGE